MGNEIKKAIQVTRSSMPSYEDYIDEIRELWNSHWLTNMGVKHQSLELNLSEYLNVPNVILFSNGHLALESVLTSLQLTGEVITTPFTFASTTHAIVRTGLTPVFCDINPNDFTIDAEQIEALITERTSAIIPVHVYGNICDVEKIDFLSKKYNLPVIYDAAHAFGVSRLGKGVASFGNASMFSFHATKVFNTIEGGAITCADSNLANDLKLERNFGITGPETVEQAGGNAKMNEFQAAMGLCNLRNVEIERDKRRQVYQRYVDRLQGTPGIRLNKLQEGVQSNYSYFPVVIDGYTRNRDEIAADLAKENIFIRKYFYPITSDFSCYKDRFDSRDTPIARYMSQRIITLPIYADLTLPEVDLICEIISGTGRHPTRTLGSSPIKE